MFSANHRQHLLVAFGNLDESLAEIARCLEPAPSDRVFPRYADPVDDGVRARVRNGVADVRGELRAFMAAQHMQAPVPTLSSRHAAHARASLALSSAMELDAQHLAGYGELSPEERSALDALSDRLSESMMRLMGALAH